MQIYLLLILIILCGQMLKGLLLIRKLIFNTFRRSSGHRNIYKTILFGLIPVNHLLELQATEVKYTG